MSNYLNEHYNNKINQKIGKLQFCEAWRRRLVAAVVTLCFRLCWLVLDC